MEEKKYLSLGGKIGYGMGDGAWCFVSCILTSFMMIYLTDTVGLDAAIVGSMMLFARLFDGFTDVVFGRLLDKTHTKWGKARPWMFGSIFGAAISMVALFSIPESMGESAKYVYFFIFYMMANTIFYTSGYISYSSLISLITRNSSERVQATGYRTMAGNLFYMALSSVTILGVDYLGGGAQGWRRLAMIYAVCAIVVNTISVMCCKELPMEEAAKEETAVKEKAADAPLGQVIKALLTCKYFYFTLGIMILLYVFSTIFGTTGVYYAKYVLGNTQLIALLSSVNYGFALVTAFVLPLFVKKISAYKLAIIGTAIGTFGRVISIAGGYAGMMMVILVGIGIGTIGKATVQTFVYPMMASTSDYIYLKKGIRVDGAVFSCSSMGIKMGQGLGSALCGALLSASGYVANAATQTQATMNVLTGLFLWGPFIINLFTVVLFVFLNVDKVNAKLRGEKAN